MFILCFSSAREVVFFKFWDFLLFGFSGVIGFRGLWLVVSKKNSNLGVFFRDINSKIHCLSPCSESPTLHMLFFYT